jgi:hypothetical protein
LPDPIWVPPTSTRASDALHRPVSGDGTGSPLAAPDLQYFNDLDDPRAMRHRFHPRRVNTIRNHRSEQMKLSQKQIFTQPPQSR